MTYTHIIKILISLVSVLVIVGCSNDHYPLDEGETKILLDGDIAGLHFRSDENARTYIENKINDVICESTDKQNFLIRKSAVVPLFDNPFVMRSKDASLIDHYLNIRLQDIWGLGADISYQLPETAETGDKQIEITCSFNEGRELGKAVFEFNVYKSMQELYLNKGLTKIGFSLVFFFFAYLSRGFLSVNIPEHGSYDEQKAAESIRNFPISLSIIGFILFCYGLWQAINATFF